MNTYQIFIKTTKGYAYYAKTPIYSQALVIEAQLQARGYEVMIRKNGQSAR